MRRMSSLFDSASRMPSWRQSYSVTAGLAVYCPVFRMLGRTASNTQSWNRAAALLVFCTEKMIL